jgi:hypothetical protein
VASGAPLVEATPARPATSRPERWFRHRWVRNLGVLALYLIASVLLFGLGSIGDPAHRLVGGVSSDADAFLWFLAWWPHAIAHGIDPFFTRDVWAPNGISLIWTTSVPVPALVLAPITAALGPITSFDVLQLLGPALSAWTTYLLCRRVGGTPPAAFAGGWFLGFGSYEVVQVLVGHPNLGLLFPVPLCAYLIVRRLEGSLGPVAFVVWLGLALAAEFGISTEFLATMTLMGVLAGGVGLLFATPAIRTALVRAGVLALGAYALAAVLVSPGLYAAARLAQPTKRLVGGPAPTPFAQVRSFVLPGKAAQLHGGPLGLVPGGNGAYLSVAVVAILVLAAATGRHRRIGSYLLVMAATACGLTMGDSVRIGGATVRLPWHWLRRLPLIGLAAPTRIVAFAALAGAVAIALFASGASRSWSNAARWTLVVLALVSVAPNLTGQDWSEPMPNPPFFADGRYANVLRPGETVIVVWPRKGDKMYWQVETGWSMRLASGYLGLTPPGFRDPSFASKLSAGVVGPGRTGLLRRFVREHDVAAIVVVRAPQAEVDAIEGAFASVPTRIGGVLVYRLGP